MLKNMGLIGVVSGFSPPVQPVWFQKNIWRRTPYFSVWGWVATRQNWSNYSFDISKLNISKELATSCSWKKLSSFKSPSGYQDLIERRKIPFLPGISRCNISASNITM